jgi:hypothetical protein
MHQPFGKVDYGSRVVYRGLPVGGPPSGLQRSNRARMSSLSHSSVVLRRGPEGQSLATIVLTGSRQLVEQGLGVLEVGGVEAFGEPAIDRREQGRGPFAARPYSPTGARGWSRRATQGIWPLGCGRYRSPAATTMQLRRRRWFPPGPVLSVGTAPPDRNTRQSPRSFQPPDPRW